MERFSGHQKRVTLNLARHSAIAREREGLVEALEAASAAGWDLDALPQRLVETIYANFDEAFEKAVLSEFRADPNYLIDLRTARGTCPLCGHNPIRWVFRVRNLKGGASVECGSECILTYGINVLGAETAEHARLILEGQIRKAIRRLQIEAWFKETGFEACWFQQIDESLDRIRDNHQLDYGVRRRIYWIRRDLGKLKKFFKKSGWLGTEAKWNELVRIVAYCRPLDKLLKLPYLAKAPTKEERAAVTKKALESGEIKTEALVTKAEPVSVPAVTLELPLDKASEVVPEPVVEETEVNPEREVEAAEVDPDVAFARAQAEELRRELGLVAVKPAEPVVDLVGNLARALVAAADRGLAELAENAEAKLAEEECKPAAKPVVKPTQLALDFGGLARELVFGK